MIWGAEFISSAQFLSNTGTKIRNLYGCLLTITYNTGKVEHNDQYLFTFMVLMVELIVTLLVLMVMLMMVTLMVLKMMMIVAGRTLGRDVGQEKVVMSQ